MQPGVIGNDVSVGKARAIDRCQGTVQSANSFDRRFQRGCPPVIAARVTRAPEPVRVVAAAVIAAAWIIALGAALTGSDAALHHDALGGHHPLPTLGTIAVVLLAWQVMTAGMMLPSSLPLINLFVRASAGQERPGAARAAFFAAYFAVWTWFALMAVPGIAAVHWLAAQSAWLRERPDFLGGAVLILAGAFQFSPLKERCLRECRAPLRFLQHHYRRGIAAAWDLGLRHGLFCLGCCWALMLTMFAVGVGNMVWMAALTGVMVIEKTMPWGRKLAPVVGVVLVVAGAVLAVRPAG
jgi:predicted metal-binding membrane protein